MSEYYIPVDGREQLVLPRSELIQATHSFARRVRNLLRRNGIGYLDSQSRTKSEERMKDKIRARNGRALGDIHGILFIMEEGFFDPTFCLLRSVYPTPDVFPSEIETLRDRRDERVRGEYNSASLDSFQPMIFNLLIPSGARIAEVQLMTPETYRVGQETRGIYIMAQKAIRAQRESRSTQSISNPF